jgi:hypothetical protein
MNQCMVKTANCLLIDVVNWNKLLPVCSSKQHLRTPIIVAARIFPFLIYSKYSRDIREWTLRVVTVVSVYSIFDHHPKMNVFSDEITIIYIQNALKIRNSSYIWHFLYRIRITYFHFSLNLFFDYSWCWPEDISYQLCHTISWYFLFFSCYVLYICWSCSYSFVRSFLLSWNYLFSTCISCWCFL